MHARGRGPAKHARQQGGGLRSDWERRSWHPSSVLAAVGFCHFSSLSSSPLSAARLNTTSGRHQEHHRRRSGRQWHRKHKMVSEHARKAAAPRSQSSRPGFIGVLALGPLQPKIAPPELKGMMDKKLSGEHACRGAGCLSPAATAAGAGCQLRFPAGNSLRPSHN